MANDRGQQTRQRFERRKVDVRPLPPADGRTGLPVEHPQRHFELGRAAGQATVGYGNAAPNERTVDGDLLPGPRVELVENPAFGGTVGVRESSCTTTDVLTWPSAGTRRPRCSSATGPACCWRRVGEVKALHPGMRGRMTAPRRRRGAPGSVGLRPPSRGAHPDPAVPPALALDREQMSTTRSGSLTKQRSALRITKSRGHRDQSGTHLVLRPGNSVTYCLMRLGRAGVRLPVGAAGYSRDRGA